MPLCVDVTTSLDDDAPVEGGALVLCFPHRSGDGEHVWVSEPALIASHDGATGADTDNLTDDGDGGRTGGRAGDESSIDLLLDLRGEGYNPDEGYNLDEYPDEMWKGTYQPLLLPDGVPGRVWMCSDEGSVGLVWQREHATFMGPRVAVLFPDEYDADFERWADVHDDWPAMVFSALFAPHAVSEDHLLRLRTAEENRRALACLDDTVDEIRGRVTVDREWMTLDETLQVLGWAGAGMQPEHSNDATFTRYGAAAGRFMFEWTSRGYTDADRIHFTQWLPDPDDELLLWETDHGARFETLMGWLDGREPLLHGVDATVVVEAVRASCLWSTTWTAQQVRHLWDRGLTDPAWWRLLSEGYLREHSLFERHPTVVATGEARNPDRGGDYTVLDYAYEWAQVMPIHHAVFYLAHRTPRTQAAAVYQTGEFNPDGFRTLWALDPDCSSDPDAGTDRHVAATRSYNPTRQDYIPVAFSRGPVRTFR